MMTINNVIHQPQRRFFLPKLPPRLICSCWSADGAAEAGANVGAEVGALGVAVMAELFSERMRWWAVMMNQSLKSILHALYLFPADDLVSVICRIIWF
jgi:hypothetical protein